VLCTEQSRRRGIAAVPAAAPATRAMAGGDTQAAGGGLLPCGSRSPPLIWLFPTLSVYFFIYL